jgi:hypothetical protein
MAETAWISAQGNYAFGADGRVTRTAGDSPLVRSRSGVWGRLRWACRFVACSKRELWAVSWEVMLCDGEGVTVSRVAAVVTCVVVAGLGVWFVVAWAHADRLAVVVSALAAVATVGLGVWAAVRGSGSGWSIRVLGTGRARAGRGGGANSGVRGGIGKGGGSVRAQNTGDADASGGGDANTGVRWD